MTTLDASLGFLDKTNVPSRFCSSSPVVMLDHFRVPYELDPGLAVDGLERLVAPSVGSALLWKRGPDAPAVAATMSGADRETPVQVFARILPDNAIEPLLRARGGEWHQARVLTANDGTSIGSIWRDDAGNVFLPFDPNEVVEAFWSERYLHTAQGTKVRILRRALMRAYYRIRPLLPRRLQIWLRRRFARVQARATFPRWPVETCLHDFFELMFAILAGINGAPVPRIASWPDGHSWALVLSHDVEQAEGLAAMHPVLELERARGLRSAWNVVPRRYPIDPRCLTELSAAGFEVGVHGPYHDGRDLESLATWQRRLPEANAAGAQWQAVGFRSAALHRHWDWMRLLAFDYDSSCPDTDPFEPQAGGCCTWLPFFNGELVELPLTLPQDHTLFVILGQHDESMWVQKTEFLRDRGGMAMIDTHPDYLIESVIFTAYTRFLDRFAGDPTAWKALPRDISSWWRRRAASTLEHTVGGWRIVGPAADDGRVVFEEGTW